MTFEQKRACIITFGCLQNSNDSEKIQGILKQCGYDITNDSEKADLIIFNTCAVRDSAEKKAFGHIGAVKRLKLLNPALKIGVCGCMAAREEVILDIVKKYKYVDFAFPPSEICQLSNIITRLNDGEKRVIITEQKNNHTVDEIQPNRDNTIKASVTIMYGCNNFCSYCIVPYTRGRERSRQWQNIVKEIKSLVDNGFNEITLLGQNVNSYGKDLGENIDFSQLLYKIEEIPGEFIVRFLTSHPKDMDQNLIDTIANCQKVCNHIHLPIQSGSNKVLELMNRGYTKEDYIKKINYAREKIKDLSISTDIIVGFPGEDIDDFNETLNLLREIKFDTCYAFIYSKRKGTKAACMTDVVDEKEKLARHTTLSNLQNEISRTSNLNEIGKIMRVLVEGTSKSDINMLTGRTYSNKIVIFSANNNLIGQFVNVKILRANTFSLFGEID